MDCDFGTSQKEIIFPVLFFLFVKPTPKRRLFCRFRFFFAILVSINNQVHPLLKRFSFIWFLWCVSLSVFSQIPEKADTTISQAAFDQTPVKLRKPSDDALESFRSDRDYNYQQAAPPPENLLSRFWYWLTRKFFEFFRSSSYENFWQYVFLVTIGALVVWLLYKSEFLGGLFGTKAQEDPLAYNKITENIHELDFNSLIEEAIAKNNYRLAVRLYYLKTLKQLTDKGLIHWQPTKTNRSYVNELNTKTLQSDFEKLTSQFEYVWYGEFRISEVEFGIIKEEFQHFSLKI